jgi:hypothetical protein
VSLVLVSMLYRKTSTIQADKTCTQWLRKNVYLYCTLFPFLFLDRQPKEDGVSACVGTRPQRPLAMRRSRRRTRRGEGGGKQRRITSILRPRTPDVLGHKVIISSLSCRTFVFRHRHRWVICSLYPCVSSPPIYILIGLCVDVYSSIERHR